jgi:hypothetical protein
MPSASSNSTLRSSQSASALYHGGLDFTHPFGKELEQVNELAEEFGLGGEVTHEEEMILQRKGLLRFDASDYMAEITCFWDDDEKRLSTIIDEWI